MIFIGDDSRFPDVAQVLAYSIKKNSSSVLDNRIKFLRLSELNFYRTFIDTYPPSTEFTYTRFLVPSLMNYEGKAIFMDNDMLCLGDIKELLQLDMSDYALRVVKQEYHPQATIKMYGTRQTDYERKNWSSLMLMDCSKLEMWTKNYIEGTRGLHLHQFKNIPNYLIGELPPEWNCTKLTKETKLLHYTEGGPWFDRCKDCAYAEIWNQYYEEWKAFRAVWGS